jgi:enoyl-CoA hydratase/carnithine racemase
MDSKKIICEFKDNAAFITLNNAAKLNCIGFQMLYELEEALIKIEKDNEVKVVVFCGSGDRAFSTGADLKEFGLLNEVQAVEWIQLGNKVFNKIENLNKPTISYINGYAMGGGFELALSCDFRIGTETAVFCSPELQHGWLPGWGGMTRLRKLIGEAKAKEVVMLCEKIPAGKAHEMGLIHRIHSKEEDTLTNLINYLKTIKPEAFRLAKSALMDPGRSTYGVDVQFDILAMQITGEPQK